MAEQEELSLNFRRRIQGLQPISKSINHKNIARVQRRLGPPIRTTEKSKPSPGSQWARKSRRGECSNSAAAAVVVTVIVEGVVVSVTLIDDGVVKLGDKGFLSSDITVQDLLMNRSDVHHIYPRNHLKKMGLARGRYNQIANFVLAQSEINIAIGDKAPEKYFQELAEQCDGGKKKYGGITSATK